MPNGRSPSPATKKSPAKKRAASAKPARKPASRRSKPSAKPGSRSTEALPSEWKEFIASLCSHRVRFLLVGAHALAVWGPPRFTRDLDIFVEPSKPNSRRLGAALRAFGYAALAAEEEAFATPDRMATLGVEPLRIDIMTSITGVSFATAWKGRMVAQIGTLRIGVLGRAEFIRNKRASGRAKDLLDIQLLEELDRS